MARRRNSICSCLGCATGFEPKSDGITVRLFLYKDTGRNWQEIVAKKENIAINSALCGILEVLIINESPQTYDREQVIAEQNRFMFKVFLWVGIALAITAITAGIVASSPAMIASIIGNRLLFVGLLAVELILVWILSRSIMRMSLIAVILSYGLYSIINGLTLSIIFLAFTSSSIAVTFWVTSLTFGAMAVYGYFTSRDLTGVGSFLIMMLIGLLIASVVNMFLHSESIYWITSFIGVFVFIGLTAYDTQKIKKMNVIGNEGTDEDDKEAIRGALSLYLDFINLFLYLLRFTGRRR